MVTSGTIEKSRPFSMIDNYIYLYHTDTWAILPVYPSSISDTMSVDFQSTKPMLRTAPIYSYSSSGPRNVRFSFQLHRDLMQMINHKNSNLSVETDDDYVDTLIKQLQSIAVPRYSTSEKMVDPPLVAVRIGNEIFIKGIVNGAVSVDYSLPILENGKYAVVSISFDVYEVDPYDAEQIMRDGSMRGLNKTLERNLYTVNRTAIKTNTGR